MPTIAVLRSTMLNALNLEIAADPGVLQRNLGGSNYALMDRTCRRLRHSRLSLRQPMLRRRNRTSNNKTAHRRHAPN